MPSPIDIFAPHWSAFAKGTGCGVDSVFSAEGLKRLFGNDWVLASTVSSRASVTIVPYGETTALRAGDHHAVSEELLAYLSRPEPLLGSVRRGVLCPPPLHQGVGQRVEVAALYRELQKTVGPTLYLPSHPRDLELVADVGPATLFSPRALEQHVRAVGSAAWVISFRGLPAMAAHGGGIPTLWIATSSDEEKKAKKWGVPCLPLRDFTAAKAVEWIQLHAAKPNQVSTPDWVTTEARELGRLFPIAEVVSPPTAEPLCFASISSADFAPFVEGHIVNVLEHHRGSPVTFYVLALDNGVKEPLEARFKGLCDLRVLTLADFWTEAQLPEIHSRSVGVKAFSTKPRLIRRAVLETGGPVFYADSDVHYFQSTKEMTGDGDGMGATLFPHWNDDFLCSRKDGIYNAGMIVGFPAGLPFFNWWSERCWENANYGKGDGVVADQGYLDFGPALFDNVGSYRRGDHDVARWNLLSLGVTWNHSFPPAPTVATGSSVKSFHAAQIDSLGLFEVKFAWDSLNHFFSPSYRADRVPKPLLELLIQHQAIHWISLSRWLALTERIGFSRGRAPGWLSFAVGRWGVRLVSWLAAGRRVVWSTLAPQLPPSEDAWIKAQNRYFVETFSPKKLSVSEKERAKQRA